MLSFASSAFSSSSSSRAADLDSAVEDACSICLEPFSSDDPATVTSCKHEYHLQCILEWLQRSKECPICWQSVVLQDPASQELLAAVESERLLRSRNRFPAAPTNAAHLHQDCLVEQDSYSDDSDVDEHILQHLAAAASRARSFCRREVQRSPGCGPSEVFVFTSPERVQQTRTPPEEGQSLSYGSLGGNSPDSVRASVTSQRLPSSAVTSFMSTGSGTSADRDGPLKPRFLFAQSPTDSQDSEMSSLSESIKSKWSSASARYKESISRSTRGIKEKLLAQNNSVKELSRGVQREVSAGIAGVARMIERLDLTPNRAGSSSPVSGFTGGNTNLFTKGKEVQEIISPSDGERNGITQNMSLNAHIFCTVPDRAEVNHVQV
uniref:RING-type E3 ubiquitin transferase n=1 Tax=Rhizophora mucronata TaxID=61149 RepID=A0A2P2IHD3_RHIMU